jgi:hypothetical protein
MANPTDHGPESPDPAGRRPDPDPQAPPPRQPDDSESDFALPDLADLKDFGLSDPGRLSGVNLASGSAAGSEDDWLPPLPDEQLPGSNAEFDLPPLGRADDSLSGEEPTRAPALHVEPAFESDEAPVGEVLPAAEPESPEEAAAADSAEADLFAPVAPGTGWLDPRADDGPPSGDDLPVAEEADLGGPVPASPDSSNILSGLSEPAGSRGDSSNVRLEAPGVDATLADEPAAGPRSGPDPTDSEEPLPPEYHAAVPGGFAKAPTEPQFDLTPAAPTDDIFAAASSDESSLTGATSSIFTGLPAPPGRTDPADLADLDDVSDAVEFSDHPDRRSSDSDSLHVPDELRTAAEAAAATGLAAGAAAAGKARPGSRTPSDPSVEVDWVAGDDRPDARAKPTREPRDRDPVRRPPPPGPVNKGAVGGLFLGLLLGGGVVAGLNYAGIWNPGKADPPRQVAATNTPPAGNGRPAPQPQPQTQPPAAAPVSPKAVLAAGDPAGAVRAFEKAGATTPADRAVLGEARVYAWLREPAGADALKQARADLEAAAADPDAGNSPAAEQAAARAALYLGLTHELAGDRARAKEVYEDGRKRFAGAAALFDAALDRLRATDPDANKSSRLPAGVGPDAEHLAVLAALLFVADEVPAPPAEEPAEAGPLFWKAVNAADAGKYDDAVRLIGEAKAAHRKRAKALAGRGLNPLSDPLEQIFPRSCDDLKAYWELRKAIYDHPAVGGVAKKEGVAKALDQLATAEKRATDAVKAAEELRATNEKLAADLKTAGDKVAAAEKELKAAGEKVAAAEKELASTREQAGERVAAAQKEVKAARDLAQKELDKRAADLKAAQAEQKKTADALEGVAKVLREAKLLGDKADPAAVLAAAKLAAAKAAGGSDAVAAEMKDLSARAAKAEEAARKAAADREKLETTYKAEVTKLTADREKAEKALKDEQAAAVKKLADAHAAALDKLKEGHAAELKKMGGGAAEKVAAEKDKEIAKLKEGHAAQVKKLQDQYAADAKKLRDDLAAADKKLKDGLEEERKKLADRYAAEVKKLSADVDAARKKAADAEATAKKLADDAATAAKRAADAEAAAKKATDAEAAAKKDLAALASRAMDALAARDRATAAARALEAEKARAEELAARLRADLKAQQDRAAELAKMLAAAPTPGIGVPAGGPVSRDAAAAAARALDAGITAYKAGRYDEAERSLSAATAANPADAVGWYFLGAARWWLGKADDAREAFRRGAGAESARLVPVRVIDAAVGPIQGPARDALAAERP